MYVTFPDVCLTTHFKYDSVFNWPGELQEVSQACCHGAIVNTLLPFLNPGRMEESHDSFLSSCPEQTRCVKMAASYFDTTSCPVSIISNISLETNTINTEGHKLYLHGPFSTTVLCSCSRLPFL